MCVTPIPLLHTTLLLNVLLSYAEIYVLQRNSDLDLKLLTSHSQRNKTQSLDHHRLPQAAKYSMNYIRGKCNRYPCNVARDGAPIDVAEDIVARRYHSDI